MTRNIIYLRKDIQITTDKIDITEIATVTSVLYSSEKFEDNYYILIIVVCLFFQMIASVFI